jgi:manganese-dependent inorganic pyrophosphatase
MRLNLQRFFSFGKALNRLDKKSRAVYNYLACHKDYNRKIIVTPYHWPDIDGIASGFALAKWLQKKGYKNAECMIWEKPQDEALWIMDRLHISIPQIKLSLSEEIILVDVSDHKDIPAFIPHEKVKIIIDHRQYFDLSHFSNALSWIEPVGSAATLISQLYFIDNEKPDVTSAKLLYSAIMSNTIKCRSHNTTDKDRFAVKWLETIGNCNEDFIDEMFAAKSTFSDIPTKIEEDISSKLQLINGKQTAVGQLEIIDAENFIHKNKDEIHQSLLSICKQRSAEDIFLIILDIKNFKTILYFINKDTEKYVLPLFPSPKKINDYFIIQDIFIRKEIIALLQKEPTIRVLSKL